MYGSYFKAYKKGIIWIMGLDEFPLINFIKGSNIMKILSISFLIAMLFVINCTSTSSANEETSEVGMKGTLQSTVVLVLTSETHTPSDQTEKDDCYVKKILNVTCIERKVPISIWPVMEEIRSNYTSAWGASKENFCSLNEHTQEPGIPFEIGAKVEIIAIAPNDCQRVILMRPGNPPLKLPTSVIKVKVLDGKDKGLEGWTWNGAVKRD